MVVVVGAMLETCNDTSRLDNQATTETKTEQPYDGRIDALTACHMFYEDNARFGADICWLSCKTAIESQDYWYVLIKGKMQNQYGAWEKVSAGCVYDKGTNVITEFTLVPE